MLKKTSFLGDSNFFVDFDETSFFEFFLLEMCASSGLQLVLMAAKLTVLIPKLEPRVATS